MRSAGVSECLPKKSCHPLKPWQRWCLSPIPETCTRGKPKPRCIGDCAPSYRGCWQEHLQQLVATLAMCHMMLLLPGMLFSWKALAVAQKYQQLLNFTGQRDNAMFPCAFLSFLHFGIKRVGPASAIQCTSCCVPACGSSCPNTSGCLLNMAMDGHKQEGPQ